jgi:hypothetical protein
VKNSSSKTKANGRYHDMRLVQSWVRDYGNMNLQIVLRIADEVISMIPGVSLSAFNLNCS